MVFDDNTQELRSDDQKNDLPKTIYAGHEAVDRRRALPVQQGRLTPAVVRLLRYWRHYHLDHFRPFRRQPEAVEAPIWLSEVAPSIVNAGGVVLNHLDTASDQATPSLPRPAFGVATGRGRTTVMTILIARQMLDAEGHPNSRRFT